VKRLLELMKTVFSYVKLHRMQLGKFVGVGFTTAAIYFSCFFLFYTKLSLDYRFSSFCAYVLTVSCHFLLNRFFTFRAKEQHLGFNGLKYLSMLALNYGVMLGIVCFSVSVLHQSPYIGLLFSNCLTPFISFFLMKYFVFTPGFPSPRAWWEAKRKLNAH
jgi:putative flippase GtrA